MGAYKPSLSELGPDGSYTIPEGHTEVLPAGYECLIDQEDNSTTIDLSLLADELKHLTIPSSITSIATLKFNDFKQIETVTFTNPSDFRFLSETCFRNCPTLTTLSLPDTIKIIGMKTFENCAKLQDIRLPNSLLEICWYAFLGCPSLKTITLPASIKKVSTAAFDHSGLETIYIDSTDEDNRKRIIDLLPENLKAMVQPCPQQENTNPVNNTHAYSPPVFQRSSTGSLFFINPFSDEIAASESDGEYSDESSSTSSFEDRWTDDDESPTSENDTNVPDDDVCSITSHTCSDISDDEEEQAMAYSSP